MPVKLWFHPQIKLATIMYKYGRNRQYYIADDMLGLCRLFADDTSVGERSLEINSLRSMVNIDLNNIKHWAKQ
jgi:hypothetical protein